MAVNAQVKMATSIRGWIELKLVDASGKVVYKHAQDNLILDRGLDYIMSSRKAEDLVNYIAVGIGSTLPDPSQAALANEIARTNRTLDMVQNIEGAILGDGRYRITRNRVFDYDEANGNLTEFGGSDSFMVPYVLTRDLFRDGNGNPIVITKTSNERLIISYHIEIQFTPTTPTVFGTIEFKDNSGNVVDTRIVRHMFARTTSTSASGGDITLLAAGVFFETDGNLLFTTAIGTDTGFVSYPSSPMNEAYLNGSYVTADDPYFTWGAYTEGTYYREIQAELGPEITDRTIYGHDFGYMYSIGSQGSGYRVVYVDSNGTPTPFVKNKDYRYRFNARIHVARTP